MIRTLWGHRRSNLKKHLILLGISVKVTGIQNFDRRLSPEAEWD